MAAAPAVVFKFQGTPLSDCLKDGVEDSVLQGVNHEMVFELETGVGPVFPIQNRISHKSKGRRL